MSEPKPLASLSSSLLARKGAARPAMRPQTQNLARVENHKFHSIDDLGWNDMGEADEERHVADILPLTPAPKLQDVAAETLASDREAAAQLAENAQKIATSSTSETPSKPDVLLKREDVAARLKNADISSADNDRVLRTEAVILERTECAPAPAQKVLKKVNHSRQSALADGRRAAFTLRLDSDRHLKLRLASTIRNRSAQQIVTEALDALLGTMPELEALAAQMKRR